VSLSNPYPTGTCILADDLTGACDAAAAFASRGIPTLVSLEPIDPTPGSGVLALSTATRDVAPAVAEAAIEALAQNPTLSQFPHIFKKIDSVFRGNTFVEIAATVRAFSGRIAIIAPASPRHGRTVTGATLHIRDLTGITSTYLRPTLEATGLHPAWLLSSNDPAQLASAMQAAQPRAIFCDASNDHNLATIVQAALTLSLTDPAHPILWIGSSGLAHALAESLHPAPAASPQPPQGPVLIFTGSNHPVSHHQLTHLRGNHPETFILRIERGHTPDEEIRAAIQPFSPAAIGCILLNGGDTALQVCRALSIRALHLSGEFAPGIPLGSASGGPFDGCTVILKSGGFGSAGLLTQIACSTRQEQPA